MYNYIKCKYKLNLSEDEKKSIKQEWDTLTFLCDPILNKSGEFLIRGNGELCHSVTEFETVDKTDIGEPGVIWNGIEYARVKSTEWVRIDFTGTFIVESQIISKETDADIKIEFEFKNGYVVTHTPNIVLIDNTQRLEHDKKIKQLAITRARKFNSPLYKTYEGVVKKPLIKILHGLGYTGSYIQDIAWKLERKLNK
jgi:hypothetical protein